MTHPVRIPADVEVEDKVVANLTARQLAILSVAGIVLYGLWTITREVIPLVVFLIVAVPLGAATTLVALGRRDGLSLDRLLLAAVRHQATPRHQVSAPEGIHPPPAWLAARATPASDPEIGGSTAAPAPAPLTWPAQAIHETGVIDLGADGLAAVAVCSTVTFSLRTPAEQESLVAVFGRYLHSLTAPVQILVRSTRLDLAQQIRDLREASRSLAHPALEQAACDHADFLAHLAETSDLLHRQVLLVLREPLTLAEHSPRRARRGNDPHRHEAMVRAAETRLARRLTEAASLLSPSGITVTPLDAGGATAVLAAACNPDSNLASSASAGADEVITALDLDAGHKADTAALREVP